MDTDEIYMKRCLELAALGLGKTYPNPMVGAVLVYKNKIIGEGWHQKAGEAHAEVHAIASVKDTALIAKATLYVNLEPCAHLGKTPPCASLIVKHKIPKVVVGCIDHFSKVSGKGIEMMREAGISVTVGVLEKECKESHKRFFTFHNKKRPYIILKWAETTDGFTAPLDQEKGKPFWITSPESKKRVHKWRTEEAAILVGTKTVELDNPSLTARLWKGEQPLRVVIDKSMKLNSSLNTFNNAAKTLVFTKEQIENTKTTTYQKINFKHTENELLNELYNREIHSVIIEGGTKTLQNFIDLNLWDEARVFIGKTKLKNGISAPKFNLEPWKIETISSDILKWYKNETLLN